MSLDQLFAATLRALDGFEELYVPDPSEVREDAGPETRSDAGRRARSDVRPRGRAAYATQAPPAVASVRYHQAPSAAGHQLPPAPALPPAPTPTSAVVRSRSAREFVVVEATDAQTGRPSFVVTDGQDRAECSSRQLADRVREALHRG